MFAVVDIAGFQEKVKEGDTLRVPLLSTEKGKVTFDRVLMLAGDTVKIGTPILKGASVEAEVLGRGRFDKIRVQKAQKRKRYRRVRGHRQGYTEIRITKIVSL